MNRLALAASVSLIALTSCSTTTTVTPAQIAADLTGLVSALTTIVPQVEGAAPNALTPAQQSALTTDLADAKAALATFAAGIPAATGASKAQVIDGYINDVVATLAAVAPPPYNTGVAAAEVVLPEIEAFVNQYLPVSWTQAVINAVTPTPAPAPVAAMASAVPPMSLTMARATLGIPNLKAP